MIAMALSRPRLTSRFRTWEFIFGIQNAYRAKDDEVAWRQGNFEIEYFRLRVAIRYSGNPLRRLVLNLL